MSIDLEEEAAKLPPINIEKRIPAILRNAFWKGLLDAFEKELQLLKAKVALKEDFYNVDEMRSERRLEVARLLDVPFNLAVDNQDIFLAQEIKAIPIKAQNRGTLRFYEMLIRQLDYVPAISRYSWVEDEEQLVRELESVIDDVKSEDNLGEPIVQRPKSVESEIDLPEGHVRTKHMAVETVPKKVMPSGSLVDSESLDFIRNNLNYKKVTDVIHVGAQITSIADTSGYVDSIESGSEYTIPDIELKSVVDETNFNNVTDWTDCKLLIGTGHIDGLPYSDGSGEMPSRLHSGLYRLSIKPSEVEEKDGWVSIQNEYLAKKIGGWVAWSGADGWVLDDNMFNDDFLTGSGDVDGSVTNRTGTLPYAPIVPETIKISGTIDDEKVIMRDDGKGGFSVDHPSIEYIRSEDSWIEYDTGSLVLNTDFHRREKITKTAGSDQTQFQWSDSTITDIVSETVKIKYTINGNTYQAVEDENRNIDGPYVASGEVDTTNDTIDIEFEQSIDADTDVVATYWYEESLAFDDGTDIVVDNYIIEEALPVREIAVEDESSNIVNYAQFGSVELSNEGDHLNAMIVMKSSEFE